MKIACLQFAPQVGDVDNNLNRADSVLSKANIGDIDILVLPELAFSGYNFRSLQHISPYLEPTTSGITSLWARTTALKYNCVVTAGYPEKVDVNPKWPASPEYYNSAITVNAEGETIANYRKSFLYYTDETWAHEGPEGFYHGVIEPLGNVAMGICMDVNPYKFEASWNAWEFAYHILYRETNLVILSMAWRTHEEARSFSRTPKEPDMETLSYWISRLEPLIRNEGEEEIICVFANRTGVEDEAVYAGTSAVLGIQAGEVKVYGILGRGERELLMVDTSQRPKYQLISDPKNRPRTSNAKKTESGSHPSSGDYSDGSTKSFKSDISVSTGFTSIQTPTAVIPPPEDITFTPTSPIDDPFIQSYFGDQPLYEPPMDEPKPELEQARRPTPVPMPPPTAENTRRPTPIPVSTQFGRPVSPKSRNCSRSRGPDAVESPLLGRIISENFLPVIETSKTLDEVSKSLADVRSRCDSGPSRTDFNTNNHRVHSASVGRVSQTNVRDLVDQSQGEDAFESTFTKNYLGPRHQHILARPRSTTW